MKNFYFPQKLLKNGFLAMSNSEKSLVLACCITNVIQYVLKNVVDEPGILNLAQGIPQ